MGRSNALRADIAVRGIMVDAATTLAVRRKARFDGRKGVTGWIPFWVVNVAASNSVCHSFPFLRNRFQGCC